MNVFKHYRFNDDVFPINEPLCATPEKLRNCSHVDVLDVFHYMPWSHSTIQKFCEEQWTFLAPVFTESAAKQELPLNSILPYTWIDTVSKHSHFSRVTKAKVLQHIGTGNWRHGDLKPDNILRFVDSTTAERSLGTLKIADLGLAKLHDVDTNLRAEPTSQRCGTLKYEPPEALYPHRSPRSRRYDIWSMGCIILESIIWLLYGYDGLEVFNGEMIDDPNRETIFYRVDSEGQGKSGMVQRK
ncbi:hypothetical protein SLS57_008599 [Botryosphaeria dothidea]